MLLIDWCCEVFDGGGDLNSRVWESGMFEWLSLKTMLFIIYYVIRC